MEVFMDSVKKVIVIHKTHLDIGFTDAAANVLDRYVKEFIPQAIRTAYICNKDGKRNFVWTTGSFLIRYYLEHAEEPSDLLRAIQDGYIAWHGLACTTHTELMDSDLLSYDIEIARQLDARFSRHTIAAKMTDVPCHTLALVPALAENGIRYLHVGINQASRPLDIPAFSRLRFGAHEIIFHYAKAYGAADIFGDYALEFVHTSDNMGPPTPDSVFAALKQLQKKYPGAEIASGTLDDFAAILLENKDRLPVITCECGDTWIHGAASDPYKAGALRELLQIKNEWLSGHPEIVGTKEYDDFMTPLMLVCEHTCGLDSKLFPKDSTHWAKPDFYSVRQTPAFQKAQDSWQEQRDYLNQAVSALPVFYREAAMKRLQALRPAAPQALSPNAVYPVSPYTETEWDMCGYRFVLREDGSLLILQTPGGMCRPDTIIGELLYQVYSYATVDRCYHEYNRNHEKTGWWSCPDFAKPGLDSVKGLTDQTAHYHLNAYDRQGDILILHLTSEAALSDTYGAPRRAVISYRFGPRITIQLQWFDKDASRIPEALFFGFCPGFTDPHKLTVTKIGQRIHPYDVCGGGNRKLHAATCFDYESIHMENIHAPLLSIGGPHLYDTDDAYGPIEDGIYCLLYNNRWNTNFPLWYEENASFTFCLTLQPKNSTDL